MHECIYMISGNFVCACSIDMIWNHAYECIDMCFTCMHKCIYMISCLFVCVCLMDMIWNHAYECVNIYSTCIYECIHMRSCFFVYACSMDMIWKHAYECIDIYSTSMYEYIHMRSCCLSACVARISSWVQETPSRREYAQEKAREQEKRGEGKRKNAIDKEIKWER